MSIVQKSYACPWAFSCFRSFSFQHTSSIICMNGASSFPRFHHKAHIWSNTFIYYKNPFQFFSVVQLKVHIVGLIAKQIWKSLETIEMFYYIYSFWKLKHDDKKRSPFLICRWKHRIFINWIQVYIWKIATFKTQNFIT